MISIARQVQVHVGPSSYPCNIILALQKTTILLVRCRLNDSDLAYVGGVRINLYWRVQRCQCSRLLDGEVNRIMGPPRIGEWDFCGLVEGILGCLIGATN